MRHVRPPRSALDLRLELTGRLVIIVDVRHFVNGQSAWGDQNNEHSPRQLRKRPLDCALGQSGGLPSAIDGRIVARASTRASLRKMVHMHAPWADRLARLTFHTRADS